MATADKDQAPHQHLLSTVGETTLGCAQKQTARVQRQLPLLMVQHTATEILQINSSVSHTKHQVYSTENEGNFCDVQHIWSGLGLQAAVLCYLRLTNRTCQHLLRG